jgi:hypothetical protein
MTARRAWAPRTAAVLAVWLAEVSAPCPACAQFFPGPSLFSCPGQPTSIAAADLTDDGVLDVLATGSANGAILMLQGSGNGELLPPRVFVVGGEPVEIAVADLNHDERTDLVWVDRRSGALSWAFGTTGALPFGAVQSLPGGDEAVSLALVDLGQDGWLDVLVANQGADLLSVYRNAGGILQPAQTYPAGDQPASVRAAWWPGATTPQVVIAQPGALSDDIGVYQGASFGLSQSLPVRDARGLLLGAWDADAYPDLLALDGIQGAVVVMQGTADGRFQPVLSWPVAPSSTGLARLPDAGPMRRVVVSEAPLDRLSLYRIGATGSAQLQDSYFLGEGLGQLLPVDLDGDGSDEIVAPLSSENALVVLRSFGSGFLAYPSAATGQLPISLDLSLPAAGAARRLAVLCAGSREVRLYELHGLRWRQMGQLSVTAGAAKLRWVSLDADGRPDLLVIVPGRLVELRFSQGGGFSPPVVLPLSAGVRDVAAGDLDGDGRGDLVLADSDLGALQVLRGDGSGGFIPTDSVPLQGSPEVTELRDLDLDGRDDVLALDGYRSLYVAFSDSTGLQAPTRFDAGDEPRTIACGNFNSDGLPDIACANSGDGTFTVILSSFPRFYHIGSRNVKVPVGAGRITALDVDGNGQDDLVVSSPAFREISLHINAGDGSFVVPVTYRCSSLPLDQVGADLDGDGRGDVVVLDALGDAIVTLFNQPQQAVPVARGALSARRTGTAVELTASASVEVVARRVRDGRPIALVAQPAAADGSAAPGERSWTGRDPAPASGPERYALVAATGDVLAQAAVEASAAAAASAAGSIVLLTPSPNPSFGPVTLRFRAAGDRPPRVRVCDARGRVVARVQATPEGSGWFAAVWSGRDGRGASVGRGSYYVDVEAGGRRASVPLIRSSP